MRYPALLKKTLRQKYSMNLERYDEYMDEELQDILRSYVEEYL